MLRLTEDVRKQLLDQNEGFTIPTNYTAKNFRESRTYTIADGQLIIHSTGKTSWADSHFDKTWVADREETHQFLYNHQGMLDESGVALTKAARPKPQPNVTVVADDAADKVTEIDENNREFLTLLTAKQKALLAATILAAAIGVWAAVHYAKPVWHDKVRPAVTRLHAKLTKRPGEPAGDAEQR